MRRSAVRTMLVTALTWALVGVALGSGLACVTASRNGFHSPADVLRLNTALAALFGTVLLLPGVGVGALFALLGRRISRPRDTAFAAAIAVILFFWILRAFEFELAYPARWPFVKSFGAMLGFAMSVVLLAAIASALVGAALFAIARRIPDRAWSRAPLAILVGVVMTAVALAPRHAAPPSAAPATAPPLPNDRRVLLVGCDGADWRVVDALFDEGELPNLRHLVETGVRAPFRTLKDHPSPSLWTTIASSRSPRETGIADFYVQNVLGAKTAVAEFPRHFGLDGGFLLRDFLGERAVRVTPVTSNMVRVRRVWSILASAGVSTGVVDWLVSWPAHADGAKFLVSDRTFEALRRARGTNAAAADAGTNVALCDPPEVAAVLPEDADAWKSEDAFACATALRLNERERPQVLIAYFRDVDAAEHLGWDRWEPRWYRGRSSAHAHSGPVRQAYVAFDGYLGRLLEAVGPETTVLVVSDHGHHAWFTWLGRGTPGGHTDGPDGVFLAAGPGIRPPSVPFAPTVYDLTPTVLRLVGLPAASDMKGRALGEILTDGAPLPAVASYERGAPEESAPVSSTMDADMIERLRALGYVR